MGYWLVTGQLVFSDRTPMDTMLQHAQARPVAPSERTELDIPDAFDRTILSCLEKDPKDRPATAEDLAARLAGIETRRVVDAGPQPPAVERPSSAADSER